MASTSACSPLAVSRAFLTDPEQRIQEPTCFVILQGPFSAESVYGIKALIAEVFKTYVIDESMTFETFNMRGIDFSKYSKVVLILPGAMSCEKWSFSEEQIWRINKYVKGNLLKIFGVCAGAYFLSRVSHYHSDREGLIAKIRDFSFFKGRCVGPAFEDNGVLPEKVNIKLVPVRSEKTKHVSRVIMNGGGSFIPDESSEEPFEVIARFANEVLQKEGRDICMVACGNTSEDASNPVYAALLSSCHLEHDEKDCLKVFLKATSDGRKHAELFKVLTNPENKRFRYRLLLDGFKALGFN